MLITATALQNYIEALLGPLNRLHRTPVNSTYPSLCAAKSTDEVSPIYRVAYNRLALIVWPQRCATSYGFPRASLRSQQFAKTRRLGLFIPRFRSVESFAVNSGGKETENCPTCSGSGEITELTTTASADFGNASQRQGHEETHACSDCNGTGIKENRHKDIEDGASEPSPLGMLLLVLLALLFPIAVVVYRAFFAN
jgi:hypothetical protein